MKDVSDQQLGDHLKRLNGWWQSGRMAYYYDVRAVDARVSSFEARIAGISES